MAKDSVVIIDYGSGNLRSVAKAFERVVADENLELEIKVSSRPEDVLTAARLVLPGQGAFGDCMAGLAAIKGMREALEEAVIQKSRPFLGICVGMQLMAARGLEHGTHQGLGWIPGEVVPLEPKDKGLKIPHTGWNQVISEGDTPHFVLRNADSASAPAPHYYFVHSFMFKCKFDQHVLGWADYGGKIVAAVGRDNIIGVQFHPEKSQQDGLALIARFLNWKP